MRLLPLLTAAVLAAGLTTGAAAPALAASARHGGDTEVRSLQLVGEDDQEVLGNGGSVRFEVGFGYRWYGATASVPRIALQRYRSGGWRDVEPSSVTPPKRLGTDPFVLRTPVLRTTRASEKIRFRVVSRPYRNASGAVTNTETSSAVTVVVEDQARYTGLRRTIWRDLRAVCPTTAVRVATLSGEAGRYRTGSRLIRVDTAVAHYPAIDRRAVALHECAHEHQWLDYGSTERGWAAMKKAAATVYHDTPLPAGTRLPYAYHASETPFDPVEHGADCAAQALNPGGYLGYGGWCTAKELREGKRLLAGHRY